MSPGHPSWVDNGLDDLFGLLSRQRQQQLRDRQPLLRGLDDRASGQPEQRRYHPAVAGGGNYVSNNHVVALDVRATSSDSGFAAQVDALLTTEASKGLAVTTVMVDPESARNTILDSGSDAQVIADRAVNALRATPTVGFQTAPALVAR